MKKLGPISAAIASSLALVAISFADTSATSNKWRIELDGQAMKTGDIQFRVTPRQGESTDITMSIRAGRAENNLRRDVLRSMGCSKRRIQRYAVDIAPSEVEPGEPLVVELGVDRGIGGEGAHPYSQAFGHPRVREVDDKP